MLIIALNWEQFMILGHSNGECFKTPCTAAAYYVQSFIGGTLGLLVCIVTHLLADCHSLQRHCLVESKL